MPKITVKKDSPMAPFLPAVEIKAPPRLGQSPLIAQVYGGNF
jgi:hypothetical protein